MKLAVCDDCDPRKGIAFGNFQGTPTHENADGDVHTSRVVEIKVAEKRKPAESIEAFLARLVEKYADSDDPDLIVLIDDEDKGD